MADTSSPRVIVRERRSGTPQIRGVANNVGALFGPTRRGPTKAVRVTSYPMWQRIYGDPDPNSYASEAVKGFFDNGGSVLYFVRVVGSSGGSNAKASKTLTTAGAASSGSITGTGGPWVLAAGDTFTGAVDGGGGATKTVTATPATKTGSSATYGAGAGGDSVTITITGVLGGAAQVIDLSGAAATQASYLNEINSQLVGGYADDAAGEIVIVTDQKGSGAAASITAFGGAAAAKTGLSAGAFTNAGPNNVANVAAVTAAELAAILAFSGATTTNTSTTVTVTSNTTGTGSSFQFTGGTGVAKVTGFDTALHSGAASTAQNAFVVSSVGYGSDNNSFSVLTPKVDTKLATSIPALVASGSITEIKLHRITVARLQVGDTVLFTDGTTSTTARGIVKQIINDKLIFASAVTLSGNLTAANTVVTLETFAFSILYNGRLVQGPISGLRTSSLSKKYYFGTLLNTEDNENLVSVADSAPATTGNVDVRPVNTDTSLGDALTGGAEHTTFTDNDYIGDQSSKTGFYALDKYKDVRLAAVPGVSGISVSGAIHKALHSYCETRGDVTAVISSVLGQDPSALLTYKNTYIGTTSFGVLYYPWIQIIGQLSAQKELCPPEGHVMGMIARTIRNQGIQKAAAGEFTGRLFNVVGLERELDDADMDLLYPDNVNGILNIDGNQCVMGARTLETGEFNELQVRLTLIYLRVSLQIGTRWVLFEENTPETRARLERSISEFLEAEYHKGTLTGETTDDAFGVLCNDDNNPASVVARRQMFASAEVNIPHTTENLIIDISQNQRGLTAVL